MYEDFVLSQTALKKWEEGCRRKWKGMWIDNTIPFYSNPKMDYGKYFEYWAIGGSAKEDDEVTDLPRLKNGNISAAHSRINEQIVRFKELFEPKHEDFLGFKITNTQGVLKESGNELGNLRGVYDVLVNDEDGNEAILDLKLTSDAVLTMHPKHWGHPDDMLDVTQAEYYINMMHSKDGKLRKFYYLVFDYSPRKNVKFIEVSIDSEEGLKPIRNRIKKFREEIEVQDFSEENPDKFECDSCPLKCSSRIADFKY